MMREDKDALICDLAETYGLYDMYSIPLELLATLACGLRADSRIMLKIRGQRIDDMTLLVASVVDKLNFIAWTKTEDSRHGLNRPDSIVETLLSDPKTKENDIVSFEDGDELLSHISKLREEAKRKCPI